MKSIQLHQQNPTDFGCTMKVCPPHHPWDDLLQIWACLMDQDLLILGFKMMRFNSQD